MMKQSIPHLVIVSVKTPNHGVISLSKFKELYGFLDKNEVQNPQVAQGSVFYPKNNFIFYYGEEKTEAVNNIMFFEQKYEVDLSFCKVKLAFQDKKACRNGMIYEGFESQVNIINASEFACCMKSNNITVYDESLFNGYEGIINNSLSYKRAISLLMPSYEWITWVLFAIISIFVSGFLMYATLISTFGKLCTWTIIVFPSLMVLFEFRKKCGHSYFRRKWSRSLLPPPSPTQQDPNPLANPDEYIMSSSQDPGFLNYML